MLTQTRCSALVLGIVGVLALMACGGSPQAPTPLSTPQASPSATATPPVSTPSLGQTSASSSDRYALTLDIGSGCPVVPEEERIRKYSARFDDTSSGLKVVTLSDAAFLRGPICTAGEGRFSGIGCHQFFASEDIDTMQFLLENNNDEGHGGHIVEQLSSGGWLEIIGSASGKLNLSSMEASGSGSVWYCGTPSSYPFPCSKYAFCRSTEMRLTLTRR